MILLLKNKIIIKEKGGRKLRQFNNLLFELSIPVILHVEKQLENSRNDQTKINGTLTKPYLDVKNLRIFLLIWSIKINFLI